MNFDISLNSEINKIICESITDDNYEDFHVSLESLNDEVLNMWKDDEYEISTEGVIVNTFKKIKAFIMKLVRAVIGAIKLFWNKRTIKNICKLMNQKIVPMSVSGQVIWFVETIMKNNVDAKSSGTESLDDKYFFSGMEDTVESETGIPGVRDRERSPERNSIDFTVKDIHANHASVLLMVAANRRFMEKITVYAAEIQGIQKSEIGANVDAFIKALPAEVKDFISHDGVFGKDMYKTAGADVIFKSLDTSTGDTYLRNLLRDFGGVSTDNKLTFDDMYDKSSNDITWRGLITLHNNLDKIIDKLQKLGKNVSSSGTLIQYYHTLSAEQKTQLDKMITEELKIDKLFTATDVTLIGRSLTELARFYNMLAIKTAWCMNVATDVNKEKDLKVMLEITKVMSKQTKQIMKTCVTILKNVAK